MPRGSCTICGHGIFVQIQKNTGYCSGDCEKVGRRADRLAAINDELDRAMRGVATPHAISQLRGDREEALRKYREALQAVKPRLLRGAVMQDA